MTGVQSLMNYQAAIFGEYRDGRTDVWLKVVVPTTSLCPCSKKISDYGAHNQRSHITFTAKLNEHMWLEELIDVAESQASCEVYGILKRPDEKFVTERAYDNPKFVEDTVRDVAMALNRDKRVRAYVVEAENFESIHNHSAYAMIEHDKDTARADLVPARGPSRRRPADRCAVLARALRALQAPDHAAQEHLVESQLTLGRNLLEQSGAHLHHDHRAAATMVAVRFAPRT